VYFQEAPWDIPSNLPPKEWPTAGEVHFKNLKVRYREGLDLALKGLDIFVEGGTKVLIKITHLLVCDNEI